MCVNRILRHSVVCQNNWLAVTFANINSGLKLCAQNYCARRRIDICVCKMSNCCSLIWKLIYGAHLPREKNANQVTNEWAPYGTHPGWLVMDVHPCWSSALIGEWRESQQAHSPRTTLADQWNTAKSFKREMRGVENAMHQLLQPMHWLWILVAK